LPERRIIIVGAGIAGGAAAAVLARAGHAVTLLERTPAHRDRVRGEYMVPWGVAELMQLGLYDAVRAAGGHLLTRALPYDEAVDPAWAEAHPRDFTGILRGVPGSLAIGHPRLCDLFDELAVTAGATFLRGVRDLQVVPGAPPRISFRHDGVVHDLTPDLVIGADGRGSQVGRQAGIATEQDPPHHFLAGLLVEGAERWPETTLTIGTDGDIGFYIFPQGHGRARLYLGFARDRADWLAGPDAARHFLAKFPLAAAPASETLRSARPAGPVHAYPNEDIWADRPIAPGVVLIGDAAGYNDPTAGQGLSIALRDVRMVRNLLLDNRAWDEACFRPYVEERRERMRRLRWSARLIAVLRMEFGPGPRARRARAYERMAKRPALGEALRSLGTGPETVLPGAFDPSVRDVLLR
jgi:menaquinone-9 beta-reductase